MNIDTCRSRSLLDSSTKSTKLVSRYDDEYSIVIHRIELALFFLRTLVDKNNIPYFETSAKEGTNVEKAFETIARNALAREKEIDQQTDFPMPIRIPQQDEQQQQQTTSKCSC
jgi:ribonucleotide reductase alpha subunit